MATRPRGGSGRGGAATPSRTRPSDEGISPVFEDFKPTSEWQQDAKSHNLIIYLPGFTKEQIRVSTEGRNIIRVRGERLVASNKWSRFLEDFHVPENSEMNSIRARFQGGKLNITVPKKNVDKPQEAIPPKETSTDIPKQPIDQKSLETDQNTSDDVQRERTSITPLRDAGRIPPQDAERRGSTSLLKEKHIGKERDGLIKKTVVKEEKKSERSKELPEDETARKQGRQSSSADYGAFERQLMVNMGAAVLVLMALSAYVTYKFASGEDKK